MCEHGSTCLTDSVFHPSGVGMGGNWQVKLCDPLTTRAIPSSSVIRLPHKEALYQAILAFAFTFYGSNAAFCIAIILQTCACSASHAAVIRSVSSEVALRSFAVRLYSLCTW